MKRILSLVFLILFSIQCVGIPSVAFAETTKDEIAIYCAPDGNDNAAGTLDAPLATLDGARKRVQRLKAQNPNTPITVYFRGGEYTVEKTTIFSEADSGTENAPITYKAYKDEEPIIYGGTKLYTKDFVPVSGEMKERIPEEARQYVGVADLRKAGLGGLTRVVGFGGAVPNQATEFIEEVEDTYIVFLYNGTEQHMAQYPNGFENNTLITNVEVSGRICSVDTKGRMYNWTKAKHALIQGRGAGRGFSYSRVWIKEFLPETDTIKTDEYYPRGFAIGGQVQIANLIEELDVPGEYYIDTDTMMLYFYPPYQDENALMEVVSNETRVARMDNVSYVTFEGINFHKHRAEIFEIRYCDNIKFLGCEFKNNSCMGIDTRYCTNTLVDGCDFLSMGSTSVRFDERYETHLSNVDTESIRTDLTPDNNVINNCYFWDIAKQGVMYTGAIRMHGAGNTIQNSTFHDSRNSVIHHGGNDNKILNNEFYQLAKNCSDMGIIYNGRNTSQRGNETAYNYFHDWGIESRNLPYHAESFAVYDDDSLTGHNKHHNFFVDGYVAFSTSGTLGNNLEYNVLANNADTGLVRGHGMTYEPNSDTSMRKFVKFMGIIYNHPDYAKYDNIEEIFYNDTYGKQSPANRNLLWHNGTGYAPTWQYLSETEGNITVLDGDNTYYEYFTDPENGDYTIRTDIEVPEEFKEFQKLRLEDIGIYESETREVTDHSLTDFRACYPTRFQTGIQSSGAYLNWEISEHADNYILELASDPEFNDIILEKQCLWNYAYLTDLEPSKTYYWRVKAVDDSVIFYEEKMCSNPVMVFRTSGYIDVDTRLLESTIADAEIFLNSIVEGTEIGNMAYGTRNEFEKLLNEAKGMLELNTITQEDIDNMIIMLENKQAEISATGQIYYDALTAPFEETAAFQVFDSTYKRIDGEITVTTTGAGGMGVYSDTTAPIEYDKIYRFALKPNLDPASTTWMAFAFTPIEMAGKRHWQQTGGKGLMVVAKTDSTELQIRDGVNSAVVLSVPKTMKINEYNEIEVGIINMPGGAQLYILNVNGENFHSHYSIDNILTDDLYFNLYDSTEKKGMSAKALGTAEPKLFLGTKESFGNMDLTLVMGSASTSVSSGVKFSNDKAPNDYTITGNVTIGGKDQGIVFRSTTKDLNGDHYRVAFNGNKLMLIKRVDGIEKTLAIADMGEAKSTANIKINAGYVVGGLMISVEVDGYRFIEYIDVPSIHNSGYLGIFSNSSSFTLAQ